MLYDVSSRIAYTYDRTANAGRHMLRLSPLDRPGQQRAIVSRLDITPEPDERIEGADFFGNPTVEIAYRQPHLSIQLRVQARVERWAPAAALDVSQQLVRLREDIALNRQLTPDSPHHFLGESPRVRPVAEMTAWARGAVTADMTVLQAVEAVGRAIHRDFTYDKTATTVDTPTEESFALRRGVCQDLAHVMIGCLRGLGIPAGYVSGFLRTVPPKGKPRLEGADAMHAWVRAWCGADAGWVEYDPTNALRVGDQHIVVAVGRDYSDVAPVRGVSRTSGAHSSSQSVDIVALG